MIIMICANTVNTQTHIHRQFLTSYTISSASYAKTRIFLLNNKLYCLVCIESNNTAAKSHCMLFWIHQSALAMQLRVVWTSSGMC